MASGTDAHYIPAISGIGLAMVPAFALLLPAQATGGVAPLVIASIVALAVGAPAAGAEWRTAKEHDPVVRAIGKGLADLVGIVAVSAMLAALVRAHGALGGALGLAAWAAGGVLAGRGAWTAVPAALGLLVAAGGTAWRLWATPEPFTLLVPQWASWGSWLGPAVLAGLWAGGVGHGQWSYGPVRRPGQSRAPWAGAGLTLLLAAVLTVAHAARFEASLGAARSALDDPLVAVAGFLVLASAAASVVERPTEAMSSRVRLGAGALITLWFSVPAFGALPFGWNAVLPFAMVAAGGLVMRRATPSVRPLLGVAAGLAALAGVAAWPGAPDGIGNAFLAGLSLAAAFWWVATRATLARKAVP